MNRVLDQVMGVQEAGELWGLSADRIKGLCQSGELYAKKIGKTWVIDKNQPNPKGGRKMKKETYTVTIEDEPGTPYYTKSRECLTESQAIEVAKTWANEYRNLYIYIHYFRSTDGQKGYLNPDGYDISGIDWADEFK